MWYLLNAHCLLVLVLVHVSHEHGMLYWPPHRSGLWRYGYFSPINYNDNALWCGGIDKFREAGGRCGTCGDPFNGPHEHEAGGKYALGIIGAKYPPGQKYLEVVVRLDASHMGYFEFRICPHDNPKRPVEQQCLDKHPLPLKDTGMMRYYPTVSGDIPLTLVLPDGIKCSQCVLQWRYVAGNSWGVNSTGHGCIGCGIQETFQNCADISIGDDGTGRRQYFGNANSYYTPPEIHSFDTNNVAEPVNSNSFQSYNDKSDRNNYKIPTDMHTLTQRNDLAKDNSHSHQYGSSLFQTVESSQRQNFDETSKEPNIYFELSKNPDVVKKLPEARSSASARSTRPFIFTLYQSSKLKGGKPRILARINIGSKNTISKPRSNIDPSKSKAMGNYFMQQLMNRMKQILRTFSRNKASSDISPEKRLGMLLETTLPLVMDNVDICLLDSDLCS